MRNKILFIISLLLLVLVLIGVTLIETVTNNFVWIKVLIPMIMITGFFTFLVSVGLFLYVIINNLKK